MFLTLFSFEFIDQESLQLSDNMMNLHYSYSYLNNLNYLNIFKQFSEIRILFAFVFVSFSENEYYSYLYSFHFQKMNTIRIRIRFKITICSNSDSLFRKSKSQIFPEFLFDDFNPKKIKQIHKDKNGSRVRD